MAIEANDLDITPLYLRTNDAARISGLSPAKLIKLRTVGGGPKFIRQGNTVLYKQTDLVEWLDGFTLESTADIPVEVRGNRYKHLIAPIKQNDKKKARLKS